MLRGNATEIWQVPVLHTPFIGERSERDTYRGKNEKIGDVYWRASEASETVLGVDNAKSGICYIYVCMYGWYVCSLNARAGNFFLLKTRLFRLDSSLF